MQLSERFFKERKLEHLVENQTSYTLNNAAMHVFETHLQAEKVLLQFDQPVLSLNNCDEMYVAELVFPVWTLTI